MFGKIVAGVSFMDDTAQIAILQIRRNSITLRHLEEYSEQNGEVWFLQPLLNREKRIVRKVSGVSVALDSGILSFHSFPADGALDQASQHDQAQWEMSNFIDAYDPKEYSSDVRVLRTYPAENFSDLLVVATRQAILSKIESTLRGQKFNLDGTGANHYGAQESLMLNYPELKTKRIALAGVTKNRIDVGLIENGQLICYRYALVSSLDAVIGFVRHQLGGIPVSDVFFYGNSASGLLMNATRQRLNVNAILLNPFKNLRVASSFRYFNLYAGREHRFAAAVGCALGKR